MADLIDAVIRTEQSSYVVAHIGLNGYKKYSHGPIGVNSNQRLVWSFTIREGDRSRMQKLWSNSEPVMLVTKEGESAKVKLALMPTNRDGFGLIEFLP